MENWQTIIFEPNYEVSNLGRVRNKNTKNIKSLRKDKYGYLRVTLYPSAKTYSIHRLVAMTWLKDTYKPDLQVDHLNSNKTDNSVTNLEWVTLEENIRRIKNRVSVSGEDNPMAVINETIAFDIKYNFDKTNSEIAKDYSIAVNIVERIRRRERWVHIIDSKLEKKFLNGELCYPKGKSSNLSKNTKKSLITDIINGISVSEAVTKYGINKTTYYRAKKKVKNRSTITE